MFAKLSTIVLALAALAVAGDVSQCNVGAETCCTSEQDSNTTAQSWIQSLIGVAAQGVTVPVGVTCTPITVIGAGTSSACAVQSVCCTNNYFNGVVALGCTPVNAQL